ncbi:MAG: Maf family protein [Acidiferrobacter sp.]
MRIVLASGSPYRRALLERLGLEFEVMVPDIDETERPGEAPAALALRLAIAKAQAVRSRAGEALIIGSDQVAVYQGEIVGKSRNFAEARRQLLLISGHTAQLYTGLAVLNAGSGRLRSVVAPFAVVFRTLTVDRIERYLHRDRPYDCAGSVKSEGLGIALFDRFEGDDPTTLVGLPLMRLTQMLEDEGVDVI